MSARPAIADRFEGARAERARAAAPAQGAVPQPYAQWMPFVNEAARRFGLDPALLLGIMSRETNGHNVVGDFGHGRGLMQIDDRFWGPWLSANEGGMNPRTNILKGAEILRDNIDFFGGNVRNGVAAYNAGPGGVQRALAQGLGPDAFTTGANYSADVLQRAANFRSMLGSTQPGPVGPGPKTHTVISGDTLGQIARQYKTTVNAIARANNLSNADLIFPGQVLTIPAPRERKAVSELTKKFRQAGGAEVMGRQEKDERVLPDGEGRYARYEKGSIYWSKQTGAHTVMSPIREAWAKHGWEQGKLGYPTKDQVAVPGGFVQQFEHGKLRLDSATGEVTVVGEDGPRPSPSPSPAPTLRPSPFRADSIPYINQLNPQGRDANYWNGPANCGPAAMAMLARAQGYGRGMTDAQLINHLGRFGGTDGLGTRFDGMRAIAQKLGWKIDEQFGSNLGFTDAALRGGKGVVVHGVNNLGLMHYIQVEAKNADGSYRVNDPAVGVVNYSPAALKRFIDGSGSNARQFAFTAPPRRTDGTNPSPAQPRWHTVAFGDTLTGIASRYDTTVAALQRKNGIANPNVIFAGQRLQVA